MKNCCAVYLAQKVFVSGEAVLSPQQLSHLPAAKVKTRSQHTRENRWGSKRSSSTQKCEMRDPKAALDAHEHAAVEEDEGPGVALASHVFR
jgi:hypothetical protein